MAPTLRPSSSSSATTTAGGAFSSTAQRDKWEMGAEIAAPSTVEPSTSSHALSASFQKKTARLEAVCAPLCCSERVAGVANASPRGVSSVTCERSAPVAPPLTTSNPSTSYTAIVISVSWARALGGTRRLSPLVSSRRAPVAGVARTSALTAGASTVAQPSPNRPDAHAHTIPPPLHAPSSPHAATRSAVAGAPAGRTGCMVPGHCSRQACPG
mmetsp:Transcript_14893/g.35041  ORF Transcript_14893/g.35041 Transcript_14893/m.35041 type:complete len:213 (-) Transcript_14893:255-893(-)